MLARVLPRFWMRTKEDHLKVEDLNIDSIDIQDSLSSFPKFVPTISTKSTSAHSACQCCACQTSNYSMTPCEHSVCSLCFGDIMNESTVSGASSSKQQNLACPICFQVIKGLEKIIEDQKQGENCGSETEEGEISTCPPSPEISFQSDSPIIQTMAPLVLSIPVPDGILGNSNEKGNSVEQTQETQKKRVHRGKSLSISHTINIIHDSEQILTQPIQLVFENNGNSIINEQGEMLKKRRASIQ